MGSLLRKFLAFFILILGFLLLNQFSLMYQADVAYKSSQNALDDGFLSQAFDNIAVAIRKNPNEPNYYRGRARILITSLVTQDDQVIPKVKMQALSDLKMSYELNSNNLVTMRNLVPLYYFLAAKDVSKSASATNIDSEFLPYSRDFYEHVATVSPNDVGVYVLLAKYEKRLGLTQDYDLSIQKIKDLRPDLLDWYEGLK